MSHQDAGLASTTSPAPDPLAEYVELVRERIIELIGTVEEREVNRSLALYFLGARDAYQLSQELSVEERASAHNQCAVLHRRVTRR